jgi:hypothetical protein
MLKRPRTATPSKAARAPFKKPKLNRTISSKNLLFQSNTVKYGPEKKNIDTDMTMVNGISVGIASPAWSISPLLNGVAEGTTPSTRIGRKITLKSIQLVWTARFPTAATGGCTLRFRIVYDKQANGAAPSAISIFQADSYYAPNNLGNADRYITVVDHITDPMSVDGDRDVSGRIYKKLGLDTMYTGATSGITSIGTGSMYLFVSQSGGAAVSSPFLNAFVRLRYSDA